MYQGQAISVLLRGYQYFNDLTYLNFAKEAFSFFEYSYEQGGTSRLDAEGNFWIEEYPSKQPSFVLNGFIYALFGILDYYRVTKDHEAKMYIDKMYSTLKNCLHKYDRGYWSVYDQLKEELVSPYYQINIHAAQMQVLFELTDEEIFQYYSKKWTSNYHNRLYRQILVPIMYRVQPRIKKWL
jgi:hypothetical protein